MIAPKFRIADLVVLVLFAGLVAFAFRYEELLFMAALVVLLGSLCVATVGRHYRQGPSRAAWSTFALFGWSLMALLVLFIVFNDANFDEEELIIFCAAGFLGSCFSAYVAGRLIPREETGSPRGGG
jgi:drug/metabolite transporter (DMT)-like permease